MATSTTDPRDIIDQSTMTTAQIVVVILTVLLNAMDGFDVLSIAFASPGIAAEWGIDRAALGIVLSYGVDRHGHRVYLPWWCRRQDRPPAHAHRMPRSHGNRYARRNYRVQPRDPLRMAHFHWSRHRRYALRHQRGGGRVHQQESPSPLHLHHGHRLPAGRRLRRLSMPPASSNPTDGARSSTSARRPQACCCPSCSSRFPNRSIG